MPAHDALGPHRDEADLLQRRQMMRDGGLLEAREGRQLLNAALAFGQQPDGLRSGRRRNTLLGASVLARNATPLLAFSIVR